MPRPERTTPSFKGLRPSSEAASRAMRRNRRSDTKPEVLLRKELWRRGLRYRKNVSELPGTPDVVFWGSHVAVFCDGDFWHGREWPALKRKLARRNNPDYWIAKISANRQRDRRTDRELRESGWEVIRVWEGQILEDPAGAAELVEKVVKGA